MGVRLQCSMRAMPMHDRHGGVTVTALVRQPIAIGPTDQSPMCMARHRRMRRGAGGAAAPPNSGKQWVKFGQTVGEIRAKQEEKIGQRKLQINPFGMWMMTSHRQCPRGGGGCL